MERVQQLPSFIVQLHPEHSQPSNAHAHGTARTPFDPSTRKHSTLGRKHFKSPGHDSSTQSAVFY